MQAVERAAQQTRRYWFEDGLVELVMGGCCVGIGALLFVRAVWLVPLLLLLGLLFGRSLLHRLRIRVTYPRTGYVAYRGPRGAQMLLGVATGAALAGVVWVASAVWPARALPDLTPWFAMLQALAFSAVFLWAGARTGLVRLSALAATSMVVGLGASVAVGGYAGWVAYFVAVGLALLVSGGLTFGQHLRLPALGGPEA